MDLRIPDEAKRAFRALLNWPEGAIPKFVAAIHNSQPTLVLSEFAQQVSKESGQKPEEVESVLAHLAGLYSV